MKYVQLAVNKFSQRSLYVRSTNNLNIFIKFYTNKFITSITLQKKEKSVPMCSSLLVLDSSLSSLKSSALNLILSDYTAHYCSLQLSNDSPVYHSLEDFQLLVSLCNTTHAIKPEDFNVHVKVTFEQIAKEGEGISCVIIMWKSIMGRGNKCKNKQSMFGVLKEQQGGHYGWRKQGGEQTIKSQK